MAVAQVISRINLASGWLQTTLNDETSCYIIGVKGTKLTDDTIDPADVTRVILELGIDSGITESGVTVPLAIQRIILNYNDILTPNNQLNGKVAFAKVFGVPSSLYIRVVAVDNGETELTTGKTNIAININSVKLIST